MRIIVAPDSFKESLTAVEAAAAIANGIRQVLPEAKIEEVPVSDGGEGLVEALVSATGGKMVSCQVTGPLGKKVRASYGLLGGDQGRTAVIEMAAASGLALVPREQRNPLLTTTYGTGELIREALDAGCRRIIVGIGGSATNDGGAGMAQSLGIRLLDDQGKDIPWGGAGLLQLERIDASGLDPRIQECEIVVASDVANPLCGPQGAAHVYGPQKGATPEMVIELDRGLARLAEVVRRDLGVEVLNVPGAGAAGGLGAGLMAFLGAKMRPGIELVLEAVELERKMAGAQLVFTGEGQINFQSAYGKVPVGVAQLAKRRGLPVIAVVGSIGSGAEAVYEKGIDAIVSIMNRPMALEEALVKENATKLLADASARTMMLLKLGSTIPAWD